MLPRITRAQSMDILSSQANLAGYKAVIEAFHYLKSNSNDDDSSRHNTSCKSSYGWSRCSWITSNCNCKKNGSNCFATDVRMASKEQVESLGGKFLVEGSENLETEGGYAKEASEDFKKKQEELFSETLKKIDIVICTALIPGKKAPKIINEHMIENMQPGSVIYDLAASQGGNAALQKLIKLSRRMA